MSRTWTGTSAKKHNKAAERASIALTRSGQCLEPAPAEFLETSVEEFREWLYRGVVARLIFDQDLIHVERGIGKDLLESVLTRYSFVFIGAEFGQAPGRDRIRFEITPNEGLLPCWSA